MTHRNIWVSLGVIFEGLGVQKRHPDTLLAETMYVMIVETHSLMRQSLGENLGIGSLSGKTLIHPTLAQKLYKATPLKLILFCEVITL